MTQADRTVRKAVVYREGPSYVEVRARPGAWFGEVRVWRGNRWPDVDRRWYGTIESRIPWFSLERQALKAVRYVSDRPTMARITVQEVYAAIERLRRAVKR